MDLKTLLLRSISSGKTIRGQRRLYFGNKCFSITYELKGKFLTIQGIKRSFKKLTTEKRLAKRWSVLGKLSRIKLKSAMKAIETQTPHMNICNKTTVIDEEILKKLQSVCCKATETDIYDMATKNQQTAKTAMRKQTTQTVCRTVTQGIQTARKIMASSNQTDWDLITAATQTQIDYCNNYVQTESPTMTELLTDKDRDAVIYLLNEIGEMIINQNHLIQNNSTLLTQISEMTMLNKIAATQKETYKIGATKRMQRSRKTLTLPKRNYINFGRHKCVRSYGKIRLKEMRNKAVQTYFPQFEYTDKYTQTLYYTCVRKQNRFLQLFKT